jgi:magnesium-transporting ATPase (P-type)
MGLNTFLLATPMIVQDTVAAQETTNTMLQGASMVVLLVSVAGWFVAWRFFRIEKEGKKYFFLNLVIALAYLPFLFIHFLKCYAQNFETGKEHYLFVFFLHAVILLFWSLGFYGRNKQEESF